MAKGEERIWNRFRCGETTEWMETAECWHRWGVYGVDVMHGHQSLAQDAPVRSKVLGKESLFRHPSVWAHPRSTLVTTSPSWERRPSRSLSIYQCQLCGWSVKTRWLKDNCVLGPSSSHQRRLLAHDLRVQRHSDCVDVQPDWERTDKVP